MVEQLTVNQPVVGSNPASGAIRTETRKDLGRFRGLFAQWSLTDHKHWKLFELDGNPKQDLRRFEYWLGLADF